MAKAQAIIVAEYRGLAVGHMTQLRAKARQSGIYFRVLKNSLARRAIADTPFTELSGYMVGPLAYGIGSDPVAAAKVLYEFAKGNDKFVIKAGAMANFVMSDKEIASLALSRAVTNCFRSSWARCRRPSPILSEHSTRYLPVLCAGWQPYAIRNKPPRLVQALKP